jgi:hypothetical protein
MGYNALQAGVSLECRHISFFSLNTLKGVSMKGFKKTQAKTIGLVSLLLMSYLLLPLLTSPAIAQEQEPFRVPKSMTNVKILHQEPPVYPTEAKAVSLEAVVNVEVTISPEGTVSEVKVLNCKMAENKQVMDKLVGLKTMDKSGEIIEVKENEQSDYYTQQGKDEKMRTAFSDAACAAAKKWTFEPVKIDGKASSIVYPLEFKFNLSIKDKEQQQKATEGKPKEETPQE